VADHAPDGSPGCHVLKSQASLAQQNQQGS